MLIPVLLSPSCPVSKFYQHNQPLAILHSSGSGTERSAMLWKIWRAWCNRPLKLRMRVKIVVK